MTVINNTVLSNFALTNKIDLLVSAIKETQKSIQPILKEIRQIRARSMPHIEEIERMRQQYLPYIDIIEKIQRETRPLAEVINQTRPLNELIQQLQKEIQPYTKTFQEIQEISKRVSINATSLALSNAYQQIVERYKLEVEKGNREPVQTVVRDVKEQVLQAPLSSLSAEFYLSLIFALVLFILSYASTKQSEEVIISQIKELKAFVEQKFSNLSPPDDTLTYYVVKRPVRLREKPATQNSKILTILFPNQRVKLIERKSKWINVEYFDYLQDKHKCGWVYKKYLKILNPKK